MSNQTAVFVESVLVHQHRKGILVDGIEQLKGLLSTFMQGSTRSSGTTNAKLGDAGILLAVAQSGNESPFLKSLFADVETQLKGSGTFQRSFDYGGAGPFLKSTVEIHDLKGEDFVPKGYRHPLLLHMHAAYVGSKIEDGLAEAVHIDQGVQWTSAQLTLAADGPTATVDVDALVAPLREILGLPTIPAERIADKMLPTREGTGLQWTLLKMVDDEIQVTLGVDSLSLMAAYKPEQKFVREGAVLTALRADRWDTKDTGQYARLRVNVNVGSLNSWRMKDYWRMPVLRPEEKALMLELGQRIGAAYVNAAGR